MRVLVIGGTNFIGPYVVRQLVEAGCEVAVFNRGRAKAGLPKGVRRVRGDRSNLADHAGEFRRLAPEVVLDMIPMNGEEAQDVMSVLTGVARRIVAISSGDVYRAYDRAARRDPGATDPVPLDEDAPLREKLYPYETEEYEKILVERVVSWETSSCPAPSCGYPRCTDQATTSTGSFPTSNAWTMGGPGSCSQKAWPPGVDARLRRGRRRHSACRRR